MIFYYGQKYILWYFVDKRKKYFCPKQAKQRQSWLIFFCSYRARNFAIFYSFLALTETDSYSMAITRSVDAQLKPSKFRNFINQLQNTNQPWVELRASYMGIIKYCKFWDSCNSKKRLNLSTLRAMVRVNAFESINLVKLCLPRWRKYQRYWVSERLRCNWIKYVEYTILNTAKSQVAAGFNVLKEN